MGPHAIERQDDGNGPRYRLVGPGVVSKWYVGQEQLERLEDIRDLMNFAVRANLPVNERPKVVAQKGAGQWINIIDINIEESFAIRF